MVAVLMPVNVEVAEQAAREALDQLGPEPVVLPKTAKISIQSPSTPPSDWLPPRGFR